MTLQNGMQIMEVNQKHQTPNEVKRTKECWWIIFKIDEIACL